MMSNGCRCVFFPPLSKHRHQRAAHSNPIHAPVTVLCGGRPAACPSSGGTLIEVSDTRGVRLGSAASRFAHHYRQQCLVSPCRQVRRPGCLDRLLAKRMASLSSSLLGEQARVWLREERARGQKQPSKTKINTFNGTSSRRLPNACSLSEPHHQTNGLLFPVRRVDPRER